MNSMQIATASHQQLAQIRALAKARIDFFGHAILGYQITPFHSAMLSHQLSTPDSMVLAPRGGGKSTVCDIVYCLWRLVNNPNLRICIASKSEGQAVTFLSEIKQHIAENRDFIAVFGDLKGSRWNDNEIIIKTRSKIMKEPSIVALGAGGGIVGRHFDIIIGDDLVDLENSRTDIQRHKVKEWFYSVLRPTLEPDGEIRIIGTRYHPDDLYGHFAYRDKKTGEYRDPRIGPHVLVVPAIKQRVVLDEKGNETLIEESFWPEKFTLKFLQETRAASGSAIFALQYQNDASVVTEGYIRLDDLEPYIWTHRRDWEDKGLIIFQGVDPAISQKTTADYFAHQTIGVDRETGDIYDLARFKGRLSFHEQVDYIVRAAQEWEPVAIGIENNAYQDALAQEVARHFWMPVLPLRTKLDKVMRTKIFSAITEQHRLHLSPNSTSLMENLVNMPNVQHDDEFDALYLACEAAKHSMLDQNHFAVLPTNFLRR